MKYILLMAALVLILGADVAEITQQEYKKIHHNNFKMGLKTQEKSYMHRIHKVDETQAKEIATKETNEKVSKLKLEHRGRVLFYKVYTQHNYLEINAMDATVMKKDKRA